MLDAAEEAGVEDHLGPVPLRLARLRGPGGARTFRSASPTSPWRRWSSGRRHQPAADGVPAQRDQLHLLGGGRRLFPAGPGRRSKAGSRSRWCAAGHRRIAGDQAALARIHHHRRGAADPHRAAQPPPADVRAAERNLQGMYEAYDWILGLAARARRRPLARRCHRAQLLPAQPMVFRWPDDPHGPS